MIKDFQIKGLQKLLNRSSIKDIYPMIDRIDISFEDTGASGYGIDRDIIDLDIHLNNPKITKETMYENNFDPHYLIDYHITRYLPYLDIKNVFFNIIVWGPDDDIIYSFDY